MNLSSDQNSASAVPPSPEVDEAAFQQALQISAGLFAHQIEGIAFLLARRRSILADDMGLGKTRQAIVALRHAAPDGPFLVVCPASVKLNWVREIRQVDASADCVVLSGNTGEPLPRDSAAGPSSTTMSSENASTPWPRSLGSGWSSMRRIT